MVDAGVGAAGAVDTGAAGVAGVGAGGVPGIVALRYCVESKGGSCETGGAPGGVTLVVDACGKYPPPSTGPAYELCKKSYCA